MGPKRSDSIVVGVVSDQPDAVVVQAGIFASHFAADLVFASVDPSRYQVDVADDGTVSSLPFDPDLGDLRVEVFDPELRTRIATLLDGSGVNFSTRALAGDPAHNLGALADQLGAAMIVVGTREPSLRGTIKELVGGSVAAKLAHRQHRPVVVIPLAPVTTDATALRAPAH